jgi:hypothetical protein
VRNVAPKVEPSAKAPNPQRAEPKRRPERAVTAKAEPKREPQRAARARPALATAPKAAHAAMAPRPAVKASGRAGLLRINSRPWSKVYVDNRLVGNTPQTAISLSPGKHRVTLVSDEFELKRTLTVEVRAGKTVTRVVEMMQ